MSLNQLDSKKQLFILMIVVFFLLGLYLQFRVMPAVNDLTKLNKQLQADETLLKNPNIPEEPLEDIDDLKDRIAVLEVELEELTAQSSSLAKNLPEINSQDVMLKISEAARANRVRIVSNVPFLAKKRPNFAAQTANAKTNKQLSIAEQRKRERALRKAMQRAKKQAAQSGAAAVGVGVYTQEGELMDKLVNDFEVSRPLHEVKIEGTYVNVKAFIEALQGMPWQITVVKIDFSLLGQNTAQGYPQPIMVEMIIGA
jgi:ribosomal protein L25 (general stress protein Ctc)